MEYLTVTPFQNASIVKLEFLFGQTFDTHQLNQNSIPSIVRSRSQHQSNCMYKPLLKIDTPAVFNIVAVVLSLPSEKLWQSWHDNLKFRVPAVIRRFAQLLGTRKRIHRWHHPKLRSERKHIHIPSKCPHERSWWFSAGRCGISFVVVGWLVAVHPADGNLWWGDLAAHRQRNGVWEMRDGERETRSRMNFECRIAKFIFSLLETEQHWSALGAHFRRPY